MNEESTIKLLNTLGTNLVGASDQYSSYDAEDKDYIVEIKNRRDYYRDKQIECLKLFKNFQKAQLKDKQFLYVVTDNKGMHIFNISKNMFTIVSKPPIGMNCPVSTDFNSNKRIKKYTYNLPESMAKTITNE